MSRRQGISGTVAAAEGAVVCGLARLELAGLQRCGERPPLVGGERKYRSTAVLRVTDSDHPRQVASNLDTVDQDGYTELRYWADPAATPTQAAYAITSALAAVTPSLAMAAGRGREQSSGPVRPREPDQADAELRQRMEQLEPGHPSSPYKGDGSPKPPVPDPAQNELPTPGDPDYRPEDGGSGTG
jgi:hypothetical protein